MGAGPLMALNKVIQLTQSHRGLLAGMLSGNEGLAARRPAMRDAVGKAAQALDTEWSRCRGIAGRSDALVRFAAALGNAGLSLDPAADTCWLATSSRVNMPRLAENRGVMRALGSSFLTLGQGPCAGLTCSPAGFIWLAQGRTFWT